jgi:predicted nucleic acid-binding protein
VIVLDTTVLVYATGAEHPLRAPCRRVVQAVGEGRLAATTTAEVIAERVAVRGRRRPRADAVEVGRRFTELLSPLASPDEEVALSALDLYERHPRLGSLDAVLAALVLRKGYAALVSASRAFGSVRGLKAVDPATPALDGLLAEGSRS